MFRITGPPEDGRLEPTLFSAPRLVPPDLRQLDAREGRAPANDRQRVHWRGPAGSLILHLLPLLLLIEWPMAPPPEIAPIAVQLVVEPPPPEPTPQPVPPQPEFKPPPPGRIASDDLGDPTAKEVGHEADAMLRGRAAEQIVLAALLLELKARHAGDVEVTSRGNVSPAHPFRRCAWLGS